MAMATLRCSVAEAAKKLRVNRAKLYQMIYSGEVKATKRPGFLTMVELKIGTRASASKGR